MHQGVTKAGSGENVRCVETMAREVFAQGQSELAIARRFQAMGAHGLEAEHLARATELFERAVGMLLDPSRHEPGAP